MSEQDIGAPAHPGPPAWFEMLLVLALAVLYPIALLVGLAVSGALLDALTSDPMQLFFGGALIEPAIVLAAALFTGLATWSLGWLMRRWLPRRAMLIAASWTTVLIIGVGLWAILAPPASFWDGLLDVPGAAWLTLACGFAGFWLAARAGRKAVSTS